MPQKPPNAIAPDVASIGVQGLATVFAMEYCSHPRQTRCDDGVDGRPVARVHDMRAKAPNPGSQPQQRSHLLSWLFVEGSDAYAGRDARAERTAVLQGE